MSSRKGKLKKERSNSFAPDAGPVPGAHRPPDVAWRQQNLPGKLFVLTPANVVTLFFIIGCAFLPCGIFIVNQSTDVVEVIYRYDKICENTTVCQVNVTIPNPMFPPVYVYYQLTDFFQNHRRYVTSRSDPQLMGTVGSRGGCGSLSEYNGSTIVPCGLIANSFFNDTITATACGTDPNIPSNSSLYCTYLVPLSDDWNKEEIAWSSDSKKFSYSDPFASGGTNVSVDGPPHVLPRVDDPDLWVWMRTSGLSTLRKLYRIIKNRKLPKDSVLTFTIVNNFPVNSFGGSKSIVVTTMNWLGAKNPFLGWLFIGVACWCLFCGIAGLIKMAVSPRQLGDMRFFKWEVLPPSQPT